MNKDNLNTDELNYLAYEYALGLLSKSDIAAYKNNADFIEQVNYWQDALQELEQFSPLDEVAKARVWQTIEADINQPVVKKPSLMANINQWLTSYRTGLYALLVMVLVGLWTGRASGIDWDIEVQKNNTLYMNANAHMHLEPNTACSLWTKSKDGYIFVTYLPETGEKGIKISTQMAAKVKSSIAVNIGAMDFKAGSTTPDNIVYEGSI